MPIWQLRRRLQSRTGARHSGASRFAMQPVAIVVDDDLQVRLWLARWGVDFVGLLPVTAVGNEWVQKKCDSGS